MVSDQPKPPPVYPLPENALALNLYRRFSSQWRVGASGAVGLDMNVFLHELDRLRVSEEAYDYALWALGVIEDEALKISAEADR